MTNIENLQERLTSYFIKENGITADTPHSIEEIDPKTLLTPERFDLLAKLTYIEFRERGLESSFGEQIYRQHIDAFSLGSNSEPGDPHKNNIDDYLQTFDTIIDDIKENGFDATQSLVPVGKNNIALNGAHRIAACIYFERPITVIRFNHLSADYGYKFFLKRGLSRETLDYLALKYCELKENTFALCLWPKAYTADKFKQAEQLIQSNAKVTTVYRKNATLSFNGLHNLLLQIYSHETWTGDYTNGFKGTDRKVDYIFAKNSKVQLYILESDSLESVTQLKLAIREHYNIGNDSIHSTDNQAQTLQMAKLLLNQHSLHHLERAAVAKYPDVHKNLEDFKNALRDQQHAPDDFIIDSGSVLSIYGIRPANDFDYLSRFSIQTANSKIELHEKHQSPHTASLDDLIYNPRHHFYFQDVKFVNLKNIAAMKAVRNEDKDRRDIRLLNAYLGGDKNIGFYLAKFQSQSYRHRIRATIFIVNRLDAAGLKEPIKKVVRRIKR